LASVVFGAAGTMFVVGAVGGWVGGVVATTFG
jgi:hypothetical protein